jgi:HD superfamily phosphodiesterase
MGARLSTAALITTGPKDTLFDNQQKLICEFIVKSTKCFDNSHNWEHARDVLWMSEDIAAEDKIVVEHDVVSLSAVMHDICDHKYKDRGSISEEELYKFIEDVLNQSPSGLKGTDAEKAEVAERAKIKTARIKAIIDNVSWSKQSKARAAGQPENPLEGNDAKYLEIIRDADRIHAIGVKNGADRCRIYTIAANPGRTAAEIEEMVVQHCNEKLLKLYPENYITTPAGRRIAEPLHQELKEWVTKQTAAIAAAAQATMEN